MDEELDFLKFFPKERDGMYIVYELYIFDNFFRLLLKNGYDHEDALIFVFATCSLSAYVFQERIHNKRYCKLDAKDALPPELSASKAQFICDILSFQKSRPSRNLTSDHGNT